jgi:hypothetical protein
LDQYGSDELGTRFGTRGDEFFGVRPTTEVEDLGIVEAPVSGHVFRRPRKSGDRWMAKWRDAEGQHQRVLAKVWAGGGCPPAGYLTKRGAQRALDDLLTTARAGRPVRRPPSRQLVTLAQAADEWLRFLEVDRRRRPSTIRDYRRALCRRLLPAFGDGEIPAAWLTVAMVERFREQLVYRERLARRR